jgi:hypothetical protein
MKTTLAEALISALIDDKKLPRDFKNGVKNITVPCIEMLEEAKSPKETYDVMIRIMRLTSIAIGLGIDACCQMDKEEELTDIILSKYKQFIYEQMQMIQFAKLAAVTSIEIDIANENESENENGEPN